MIETETVPYGEMSGAEKIVFAYLIKWRIAFVSQKSLLGGRAELGGSIVDFLLQAMNIAIRVMGVYWHRGVESDARDELSKEGLMQAGFLVVDVWEDDLMTRSDYVMGQAIRGMEMPR